MFKLKGLVYDPTDSFWWTIWVSDGEGWHVALKRVRHLREMTTKEEICTYLFVYKPTKLNITFLYSMNCGYSVRVCVKMKKKRVEEGENSKRKELEKI